MANFVDKNGLLYFKQKLEALFASKKEVQSGLNQKVDKLEGKGLSTNDYSTTEKQKLSGISSNAQVNVIEKISINGTPLGITSKGVNIDLSSYAKTSDIPTKTSELTNDSDFQNSIQVESAITGKGYQTKSQVDSNITGRGYQTASQVNSAITGKGYQTSSQVQQAINTALSGLSGIDFKVLKPSEELPITGKKGVIYLKPYTNSTDSYEEYIWIDTKYELIGSTQVDLSNYWNTSTLSVLSNGQIDTIF